MLNGFTQELQRIFQGIFGKGKPSSKDTAKNRIQLALICDKLEISEDILKNLQMDIVEVISRYFEIDTQAIKLDISKAEGKSALVVNTPILAAKRQSAPRPEPTKVSRAKGR